MKILNRSLSIHARTRLRPKQKSRDGYGQREQQPKKRGKTQKWTTGRRHFVYAARVMSVCVCWCQFWEPPVPFDGQHHQREPPALAECQTAGRERGLTRPLLLWRGRVWARKSVKRKTFINRHRRLSSISSNNDDINDSGN